MRRSRAQSIAPGSTPRRAASSTGKKTLMLEETDVRPQALKAKDAVLLGETHR